MVGPFLALLLLLSPSATPGTRRDHLLATVESRHYRVRFTGTEDQADELGKVLDLAYSQFSKLLRRTPKRKLLPLELRVYSNRDAWLDGLERDGAEPGEGLDLLWFRTDNGVVYLYRQSTPWLTRALALHGAFQQFHFAANAKHRDLAYHWYVLGLAEHLSIHRWDGRRLELGARPRVCSSDMPAQAMELLGRLRIREPRLSNEDLVRPALAWALVSFLSSGIDEERGRSFRKLALGLRGSKLTGDDFANSLGYSGSLLEDLEAWLAGVQIPWQAVRGDWEDVGKGEIRARSLGAPAVAVLKKPATRLELEVQAGRDAAHGLVVGWKGDDDHARVEIGESWLRVQVMEDGVLRAAEKIAIQKRRRRDLSLTLDEAGSTWVVVDDDARLCVEVTGGRWGLWVEDGSASYRRLEWN